MPCVIGAALVLLGGIALAIAAGPADAPAGPRRPPQQVTHYDPLP